LTRAVPGQVVAVVLLVVRLDEEPVVAVVRVLRPGGVAVVVLVRVDGRARLRPGDVVVLPAEVAPPERDEAAVRGVRPRG